MAVVAGVDFGTQSVRVAIVDSERGPIGAGTAEYPVNRDRRDPDFATQSHASHMDALASATRRALGRREGRRQEVEAIALDTTGSTVVPVDERLVPLDDYYLWADHRAKDEAALITEVARREQLPAIEMCGGVYSSEWGFAKLLHWLRHNPDKRARFVTALEHCDMVAAVLSGETSVENVPRVRVRDGPQVAVERIERRIADRGVFSHRSIRCSPACGRSSAGAIARPTTSPAT